MVLLLPAAACCANADERAVRIYDTIADEYATCAAYHGMLAGSVTPGGGRETATRHADLRDKAIIYALTFARKGHGEEARTVITKKIATSIDHLFAEIGENIKDIPALSGKYAMHCRRALESPGTFVDEVLARLAGQ